MSRCFVSFGYVSGVSFLRLALTNMFLNDLFFFSMIRRVFGTQSGYLTKGSGLRLSISHRFILPGLSCMRFSSRPSLNIPL